MKTTLLLSLLLLNAFSAFCQDSSGISMVGQTYFQWGNTTDLELSGNTLFVMDSRFDIIDISVPANPVYLYNSSGWGYCNQIEVIGTRAFMTVRKYSDERVMYVLDVSDLSNPIILGEYTEERFWSSALCVKGNNAYLLTSHKKAIVLNATDPTNIHKIATIDSTADMICVDDERNYLYTFKNHVGLRVFDISSPEKPRQVIMLPFNSECNDMAYANERLYLALPTGRPYGVTALDVHDVMNIVNVGKYNLGDPEPERITASSTILFVSKEYGLNCYSVGKFDEPICARGRTVLFVQRDSLLCAVGGSSTMDILKLNAQNQFDVLGSMNNHSSVDMIKLSGDRLYLRDAIFDIRNPLKPVEIGTLPSEDRYRQQVDDFEGSGLNYHNVIGDRYRIYDVTDPEAPELRSVFGIPGVRNIRDIELSGDYCYLIADDGCLRALDISDLGFVRQTALLEKATGGEHSGLISVQGNYLYLMTISALSVYDLSNPAIPRKVGESAGLNYAFKMAIYKDYAYIAAEKGMYIFDTSDKAHPVLLSDSLGFGWGPMLVSGDHLYVPAGGWRTDFDTFDDGFIVLSLDNPAVPRMVGYYQTPGQRRMTAVDGDIAYVADGTSLVILDCAEALSVPSEPQPVLQPSALTLSAYPNPFNSTTTISYSLNRDGFVRMDVLDINGRLVTTLVEGEKGVGVHPVTWNATGVPAGSYIVRLNVGGESTERTVTLVK